MVIDVLWTVNGFYPLIRIRENLTRVFCFRHNTNTMFVGRFTKVCVCTLLFVITNITQIYFKMWTRVYFDHKLLNETNLFISLLVLIHTWYRIIHHGDVMATQPLLNSWLGLTTKKSKTRHYWPFMGGIPSQGNAKSVTSAWSKLLSLNVKRDIFRSVDTSAYSFKIH